MNIPRKIKQLRKRDRLTQKDLSLILGVGISSIGAYEEGRAFPPIDLVVDMCNYFDISTDYFCDRNIGGRKTVSKSTLEINKILGL